MSGAEANGATPPPAASAGARRRSEPSPLGGLRRDLRALSADLTRLALGGEEDELPPSPESSGGGTTSGEADLSGRRSAARNVSAAVSSSDESRFGQGMKAIDDLSASLSSGLSSLLGASAWPAGWTWTEGAPTPDDAPQAAVGTGKSARRASGSPATASARREAPEPDMTTISLETEAQSGRAEPPPSPRNSSPASSGVLEASLEQGGFLLQAVGRTAMSIIAPQCPCPCPTPGDGLAGSLYASDAALEAEDEDERALGGALQPGEAPSFERMFAAAAGPARMDELEELSTAAAQAAIRARACMLEPDRAGYDATLADVRAALDSGEEERSSVDGFADASSVPLPPVSTQPAPALRAGDSALGHALADAGKRAEALVTAAIAAFDAELAAADTNSDAACSIPASRGEDARRWRGCEAVVASTLERLHSRAMRRQGEAAALALTQLRTLAASVTERDAAVPGMSGTPWPANAADKARLVAARAASLSADLQTLRDCFALAMACIVAHAADAGLVGPVGRLRAQAEAYNGALHAAARAASAALARALRHLTYIIVAAHLQVALERSMAGRSAAPHAGQ